MAILAIGVAPDTNFLKEVGIDLAKTGHILVNDNYQTSDENIYTAGDAILVKMLLHLRISIYLWQVQLTNKVV